MSYRRPRQHEQLMLARSVVVINTMMGPSASRWKTSVDIKRRHQPLASSPFISIIHPWLLDRRALVASGALHYNTRAVLLLLAYAISTLKINSSRWLFETIQKELIRHSSRPHCPRNCAAEAAQRFAINYIIPWIFRVRTFWKRFSIADRRPCLTPICRGKNTKWWQQLRTGQFLWAALSSAWLPSWP